MLKFVFPIFPQILFQHELHLLSGNNMGGLSCFFESFSNWSRDQVILLNTEHLSQLERSSSHFAELIGHFFRHSLIVGCVLALSISRQFTLAKTVAEARLNPSLLNSNILLTLLLGIVLIVGLTELSALGSFILNYFRYYLFSLVSFKSVFSSPLSTAWG